MFFKRSVYVLVSKGLSMFRGGLTGPGMKFLVNLSGFYVWQKKEPSTPFLGPPVQPEHPQTSPGHPDKVYPPGRRPHPVRMGVGVFHPSLGPKPGPKWLCYIPVEHPSKISKSAITPCHSPSTSPSIPPAHAVNPRPPNATLAALEHFAPF